MGNLDVAHRYTEQSIEIRRDIGDKLGEAMSLYSLGAITSKQGDLRAALAYYQDSYKLRQQTDERRGMMMVANEIALIKFLLGDRDYLLDELTTNLYLARELDELQGITLSLLYLTMLAYHDERYDDARTTIDEALEHSRTVKSPLLIAKCLYESALLYLQADDLDAAKIAVRECLQQGIENDDNAISLIGLAAAAHIGIHLDAAKTALCLITALEHDATERVYREAMRQLKPQFITALGEDHMEQLTQAIASPIDHATEIHAFFQ